MAFVLPAVFAFWFAVGLVTVIGHARQAYRAKRLPATRQQAPGPADASADEAAASAEASRKRRKSLAGGVFWAVVGAVGLMQSGIVAGRIREPGGRLPEWSDGSADELRELASQHVAPFVADDGIGAAVAIIADDQKAVFGFGVKRIGDTTAPDGDTLFEIGSITKAFTGILLAEAVTREEVQLDQPVAELWPEAAAVPAVSPEHPITLKHLATHTSGLPRLPPGLVNPVRILRMLLGLDPYRGYTTEKMNASFANLELESDPGSQFEYSNFGAGLLGLALSRQADTTFADLVRRRICDPFEMRDTVAALNDDQRARMATGYRSRWRLWPFAVGLRAANWEAPEPMAAAGVLRSTANDMLKFLAANTGRRPSPLDAALKLARVEHFKHGDNRGCGLGWQRRRRTESGPVVIWHNGGTGGFRSFIGFTDDGRFGVAVLTNTAVSIDAAAADLLYALANKQRQTAPTE